MRFRNCAVQKQGAEAQPSRRQESAGALGGSKVCAENGFSFSPFFCALIFPPALVASTLLRVVIPSPRHGSSLPSRLAPDSRSSLTVVSGVARCLELGRRIRAAIQGIAQVPGSSTVGLNFPTESADNYYGESVCLLAENAVTAPVTPGMDTAEPTASRVSHRTPGAVGDDGPFGGRMRGGARIRWVHRRGSLSAVNVS